MTTMLLALVAWLASPNDPAPTLLQDTRTPSEPKARTTVLHLAGGTVLRVKARELAGGVWEIQQGDEKRELPSGMVERAAPESELLARGRELERSIPRGDLVRRVAYADWLVSEGLYAEALGQTDRVLEQDHDQADAIALLARAELPLALPAVPTSAAELEPYLLFVARATPSVREVALKRLIAAPEIPGLREALRAELTARTPVRRASAAVAARRLFPGSEVELLLGRAVLDASDDVREQAALSLRAADNANVIVPALRAASSKHELVRTNAIEALGRMGYREAVEPLYEHLVSLQGGSGSGRTPHAYIFTGKQTAYIQDFDVEVAQAQAIADPIINVLTEGQVLDAGVIGVTEYQVQSERAATRRALSLLTGADPGGTTAAWQRWWKEHGVEWQAGAAPQDAPTTPADRDR